MANYCDRLQVLRYGGETIHGQALLENVHPRLESGEKGNQPFVTMKVILGNHPAASTNTLGPDTGTPKEGWNPAQTIGQTIAGLRNYSSFSDQGNDLPFLSQLGGRKEIHPLCREYASRVNPGLHYCGSHGIWGVDTMQSCGLTYPTPTHDG